jgi:HD superfamily phosphohydrolase YqeK
MSTKLFKIGEYAVYGKWRITIKENIVIQGIDYHTNEVQETEIYDFKDICYIRDYLETISNYNYADKMMDYIKSKLPQDVKNAPINIF